MQVYAAIVTMLVYAICIRIYMLVYAWSHWSWGKFIALQRLNQVVLANSAFQG